MQYITARNFYLYIVPQCKVSRGREAMSRTAIYLGALFPLALGLDFCTVVDLRYEGWEIGPDRYYSAFGGREQRNWSLANQHCEKQGGNSTDFRKYSEGALKVAPFFSYFDSIREFE